MIIKRIQGRDDLGEGSKCSEVFGQSEEGQRLSVLSVRTAKKRSDKVGMFVKRPLFPNRNVMLYAIPLTDAIMKMCKWAELRSNYMQSCLTWIVRVV